jgi:HEAT repeat protein
MHWKQILVIAVWSVCVFFPIAGHSTDPYTLSVSELIPFLKRQDSATRQHAISLIERFGPEGREAIPALIDLLKTRIEEAKNNLNNPSREAIRALEIIGLEAIPEITKLVDDPNGSIRCRAILSLGKSGPLARTALEKLQQIALAPVREQFFAIIAVPQIDRSGSVAIPLLEQIVKSKVHNKTGFMQCHAAAQLQHYPDDPRAIKVLLWAIQQTNPHLRGTALQSLSHSKGRSDQIITSVLPLVQNNEMAGIKCLPHGLFSVDSSPIKHLAAGVLAAQHVDGNLVIPELLKDLGTHETKSALWLISRFQLAPPGTALEVLQLYQREVDKRIKRENVKDGRLDLSPELAAVRCLARMPEQLKLYTPNIQKLAESSDRYQQSEAAILLLSIDPDQFRSQADHIEVLARLASRRGHSVDPELADERTKLFPKGWSDLLPSIAVCEILTNPILLNRYLPQLEEWTKKDLVDWEDESFLIHLRELGPKALKAGPVLFQKLKVDFPITDFGPEATSLLIEEAEQAIKIDEMDTYVHHHSPLPGSLQRFAQIGDAAAPAGPLLHRYLASKQFTFRIGAIEAFSKIPKLRDNVLPQILSALSDKQCRVRTAAAVSLKEFTSPNQKEMIVKKLSPATKDEFADVRAAALETLLALAPTHPETQSAIQHGKQDRHPYVRLLATQATADSVSPQ